MKGLKIFSIFLASLQILFAQNQNRQTHRQSAESHDHVVIVLDASGSMMQRMRGTRIKKMDAAKKALRAVLSHVDQQTRIGLLVFSSRNLKDHWAYPLGRRDESRLIRAIEKPIASRGTPLGEYIKIGADRLLKARQSQYGYGTYRLLIVTDGEANDPELVDRYTPEVLSRGINVDVIGVDMKRDHTLAKMAHSYRRANDPASLEQAIREVFAELSNDSGGFSMEEAFELLAPFPTEAATAAIEALSNPANHPIGEGKQRNVRRNARATQSLENLENFKSLENSKSSKVSKNFKPSDSFHVVQNEKRSFFSPFILSFGFVILAIVLKKMFF